MKSRYRRPTKPNCEVIAHGNGFLANVRTFAVSSSACRPINPGAMRPGDTIKLEIVPEQGGSLTVQLGIVRWMEGDTVEIRVVLMETDAQRTIDEVAWAGVRGELKLFHWFRKKLWGDGLYHLCLSFEPRPRAERASLSEAA